MKITNINRSITPSFNALYTVKAQENPDKVDDIARLEAKYSYKRNGISTYKEIPKDNYSYKHATIRFVGEDWGADDEIETALTNKGIKFKRTSFGELLYSPDSIKERVVLSPEEKARGFKLVEVDGPDFDSKYELYGFAYVGNSVTGISQPERTERFEDYLKTGQKIYAPVVFINDEGKHPEITFGDGRHRYAYMRDMWKTGMRMKGIPVAMNEESIEIAKKYGLLVE